MLFQTCQHAFRSLCSAAAPLPSAVLFFFFSPLLFCLSFKLLALQLPPFSSAVLYSPTVFRVDTFRHHLQLTPLPSAVLSVPSSTPGFQLFPHLCSTYFSTLLSAAAHIHLCSSNFPSHGYTRHISPHSAAAFHLLYSPI